MDFISRWLRNSLTSIIFGIIMLVGVPIFLFKNEGGAVRAAKLLHTISQKVTSVEAHDVVARNEGNIIHISGKVTLASGAFDHEFGIKTESLGLLRVVEEYTEHTYVDKQGKQHVSKKWMPGFLKIQGSVYTGTKAFYASQAKVRAFTLGHNLLMQFCNKHMEPLYIDQQEFDDMKQAVPDLLQVFMKKAQLIDGLLYFGQSYQYPQKGDIRIRFEHAQADVLSVIGRQQGEVITLYEPKSAGLGVLYSGTFDSIDIGDLTAQAMIVQSKHNLDFWIWIYRLVGLLLLWAGMLALLSPLTSITSWLPIIGGVIGVGVFFGTLLLTFVYGGLFISLGWVMYRPIVFIVVIVISAGILYFLHVKGKKRQLHMQQSPQRKI